MRRVWLITNMKRMRRDAARQAGFSIVEILLAASVFGMLTTGLVGAVVYGRASTASAGDTVRAHLIAEEGIEAVRSIAGASYANLVDGSYGLQQTGSPLTWAFKAAGTTDTSDIFTRQITVAAAGTNRKAITSTVTWPEVGGGTGSVTLTTRIVNWPASLKSWTNAATPVAPAVNDITGTNNGLKTAVQGNFAYTVINVATTNNFVVTDISNPASPSSAVFSIAGTPTNIAVYGGYAYVTNQSDTAELQVVDLSTKTVVRSVDMTGTGNGQGVFIANGLAYVVRAADATASAFELTVVNIAVPTAAAVLGGYNNDIAMNEVTVIGSFAYIATSSTTQEMLVVNVSVPAAPTLTATYNPATALAATTIASYGNTVLLGMSTTLDAINVTTPASPARLGTFTAAGTINDIDVDATKFYAFLGTASTTGEFQVVNITTPASMSLTKTVDVNGTASTVSGVAYSKSWDIVVGTTAHDTQEIMVFSRA